MELPVFQESHTVLPPLYAGWMDVLLGRPIPAETEATCHDCAMCAGDSQAPQPEGFFFDPGIKCCSYIPELANFAVGRILNDADPAMAKGCETLEARLATGVATTPLGVGRHPTFQMMYEHVTSVAGFGRSRTIRCPHYLEEGGGSCSIWRHRESTCTTWFCKHVRGAVGQHFWGTLQQLLASIERDLARWCVLELDLGQEALSRLFCSPTSLRPSDPVREGHLDGVPDPAIHKANWGNWAGRERDFYQECGRLVGELEWSRVLDICGPDVRAAAHLTVDAFEQLLSRKVPEHLRVNTFTMLQAGPGFTRVQSYSNCDPIDVPRAVMDVLHCFDGRPTDEVIQSIAIERGVRIEPSLVRRLADFRILTPV
jgi:hypothetical protein